MAVGKAQICNLALAHIRQTKTTIANLDADEGSTAVLCRIHYDICRLFVLADHNWTFATKRKALVDVGSPPATWAYRYDWPTDCVQFQGVQGQTREDNAIPFKIEMAPTGDKNSILTDEPLAVGLYTYDNENTSGFPASFVSALSWYLASELAPSLSGDRNLQRDCLEVYGRTKRAAQSIDNRQEQFDPEPLSPWDQARL